MITLKKEKKSQSWDFRHANTKTYTHCYHNYPAMMIPQIAERLIIKYGKKGDILFDPYCGTGTSLVEANVKNINAIGTDLNPLARLIAETKTLKIDLQILELYLKEFNDFYFSLNFGSKRDNIVVPNFKNIDFWFSKSVQKKLATVKKFIEGISDSKVRNFFYMAFSETVRESSYTRNSEFKLYRIPEKKREIFNPDVAGMMMTKLAKNREGLKEFLQVVKKNKSNTQVLDFDTVKTVEKIPKNSIDLIVTSPPYGDSRTTVAYGQFSRLSSQWLGVNDASKVDNELMGGKKNGYYKIGVNIADETVEKVGELDINRGKEVLSFYNDYYKSIKNVSKLLKKNARTCYVVGNRKVKGITLPTDKITRAFFEDNGLVYEKTFTRNIPNKRMPSRNSPSNETGKTDNTMSKEYIVVMKKV